MIYLPIYLSIRAELEEKEHVISTLKTKITLLKDGMADTDVNNLATSHKQSTNDIQVVLFTIYLL